VTRFKVGKSGSNQNITEGDNHREKFGRNKRGNMQRTCKHTYIHTYIHIYVHSSLYIYTGTIICFFLIRINKSLLHEKKHNCTY
jgi:hypothetical protein